MGNKARRLAYSKYHPTNKAIPDKTKQEIVFGVSLEGLEWNAPMRKGGGKSYIGEEEVSVTRFSKDGSKGANILLKSEYLNAGDRITYLVIADKLLFRKGETGYLVGKRGVELKKFGFTFPDKTTEKSIEQFQGKVYPLHKYDEVTFFVTKSEGRGNT